MSTKETGPMTGPNKAVPKILRALGVDAKYVTAFSLSIKPGELVTVTLTQCVQVEDIDGQAFADLVSAYVLTPKEFAP